MIKELAVLAIAAIAAAAPAEGPAPDMIPAGSYIISAYSYEEGGGENYYTAGGWTPVPYYTVAASEEFDLGTVLYIDGIGEVQVQDRGAFSPDRIDLHIGHDDPETFGLQERAVYIVQE